MMSSWRSQPESRAEESGGNLGFVTETEKIVGCGAQIGRGFRFGSTVGFTGRPISSAECRMTNVMALC
jgi:hypothetical protein